MGQVRALNDYRGERLTEAHPGDPIEILGFDTPPHAGEPARVVETERAARQLAQQREQRLRREQLAQRQRAAAGPRSKLFSLIQEARSRTSTSSSRATCRARSRRWVGELAKFHNREVASTSSTRASAASPESDIMLASASGAMVVGFNVRPNAEARALAEREGVEIRTYRVIYQLTEEIEQALVGMLSPVQTEETIGEAEVRALFRVSRLGTIAGCMVTHGIVRRNAQVRVIRDGTVIQESTIAQLQRFSRPGARGRRGLRVRHPSRRVQRPPRGRRLRDLRDARGRADGARRGRARRACLDRLARGARRPVPPDFASAEAVPGRSGRGPPPSGRAAARSGRSAPPATPSRRLRLEPVEYPTTRAPVATPQQRARDLEAAFADSSIRAVITSIGGEDELKVLAQIDPAVLVADPKPFLGYSDNTNLHLFLWRLGLVSYHGGAVMVQLGRPGAVHPATRLAGAGAARARDLRAGAAGEESGDVEGDWGDPASLAEEPPLEPAEPWSWHGPATRVTGLGGREPRDRRFPPSDWALSRLRRGVQRCGAVPRDLGGASTQALSRASSCAWASAGCCSASRRSCGGVEGVVARASKRAGGQGAVRGGAAAVLAAAAEYHPSVPLVFGVDLATPTRNTSSRAAVPSPSTGRAGASRSGTGDGRGLGDPQCRAALPESGSLKDKRMHLRSLKAQLQNRVGASVAEVDHHDTWQRARVTLPASREYSEAVRLLDEADRWLHAQDWVVTWTARDVVTLEDRPRLAGGRVRPPAPRQRGPWKKAPPRGSES